MYKYYPEDIIEEVRISNDIVDVVMEYVRLERKGKDYFGLCPFHKEKTPSFSVAPAKQIFYCFGCGKGGNVIQFIMEIENLSYIDAVKLLADRARIQLPDGDSPEEKEKALIKRRLIEINTEAARFFFSMLNSPKGEKARWYLKNRDIKESIIRKFGIGYSGDSWNELFIYLKKKGFEEEHILKSGLVLLNKAGTFYDRFRERIMFPIFDIRGNVIAFGGRVMDSSKPKYMNSPETVVYNKSKNLYALNFAKNSGEKRLIIVEGYMDVISLHQSGIINTVASLGTALTESQGRTLKKYAEEVIISFDADTAGQAATMRGLDLLSDIGCNVKVLKIPDGKDPDEFIRKNGVDAFKKLIDKSISLVEYKIEILKKNIDTDTVDGKIKFLNKTADILSKIDNSVEREMYVKKLAAQYRISEESIFSEVYKRINKTAGLKTPAINAASRKKISKGIQEDGIDARILHDERFLLALLCVDNSIYRTVKDKITPDIFSDSQNKEIARIILERIEDGRGIVPGELLGMLENDIADDFARLFNEECHCDDNKKAILGTIRNIEMNRLKKRQNEILDILKNREELTKGDVEKLEQELMSLIMRIKNYKNI
ncbi:MAG TPA: DNA primase [Clostridiaceae bacterium]|nr:DNA primase [Clostridiaceae bacterium]